MIFFYQVSNPQSELYGKYKTSEEIGELIGLSSSELSNIINYIESYDNIQCFTYKTKDAIRCTGSISSISEIFNVNFSLFRCIFTGRETIRSLESETIPNVLIPYIELIHGISDFSPLSFNHKYGLMAKEIIDNNNNPSIISNPKKPIYIAVRSRTLNQILVEFIPPCSSSSFDISNCNSNPVINANVKLTPAFDTMDNSPIENTFPVTCSSYTNYGDIPYCSFTITDVTEYVPWIISYSLEYSSGTTSDIFTYQYFSVSTPQLVVQSVLDMYSVPKGLRVTNPNSTQCVVEFEQQYYSPSDLSLFFELNGLEDYSSIVTLIGPNENGNQPGTEGNLDIQWIMGIAPGSPTTYWSNQANSTIEIDHILAWQYDIGNMTNPPLVNSLSYAMTEATVNRYLGNGYIQRSNTQFQVLASIGLTMVFSAGDAGANSLSAPPMGQLTCNPSSPMWPAESPYVTALSATFFTPLMDPICYRSVENGGINCLNNPLGEVAVGISYGMFWTTGGGFSNTSAQAYYQSNQVNNYLSNQPIPPSSYFNSSGRGLPDVSTVGHNLEIVLNGKSRVLDGTSASAPIFAGLITLLNDLLLNSGYSPLGFVNPLLYQLSESNSGSFKDISVGSNTCGGFGPPVCCEYGFNASPGWDPVTGLGSPNFLVLYNAIKNL